MLRLSMNELTTMRWSFEEDVVEFSQAGFDGIGVWRSKVSDIGEDAAAAILESRGLVCSNLLWAGGFTGSDGCSFRDSVQDAVEAIRTAARLKCDCLVLYSGAWGGHTKSHAYRLVTNALNQILPFAEEFGVSLAIEPMHPGCGGEWTFLESVEETLSLMDPIESPLLGLVLDTYHFGISEPNFELLKDIAHRVAIVHLGDGVCEPDGEQDRCQLGDGVIPINKIVATLIEGGYDGFLDVELIGESVEPIDYPTLMRNARNYVNSLSATQS